jgi:amino acid permease
MATTRRAGYSPALSTTQPKTEHDETNRNQSRIIAVIVFILVLIVTGLLAFVYFLLRPETSVENVERLRDIFIILVALESMLIGTALIVLIIQLANLINLLQNEVRPILHATSETVNTLRGTADFLGENVVEPVIELRGYLAGLNRMLELMGLKKR